MKVNEVISLFHSVTGASTAELLPDTIVGDAGIDSMDIMRFILLIESKHGIEISGEQIDSIARGTFRDIATSIDLIKTRISPGGSL